MAPQTRSMLAICALFALVAFSFCWLRDDASAPQTSDTAVRAPSAGGPVAAPVVATQPSDAAPPQEVAALRAAPKPESIFLLGRFCSPFNKPEIIARLRAKGLTVCDQLGVGVATVILGGSVLNEDATGFVRVQELPEYKTATNLGATLLPYEQARETFGF